MGVNAHGKILWIWKVLLVTGIQVRSVLKSQIYNFLVIFSLIYHNLHQDKAQTCPYKVKSPKLTPQLSYNPLNIIYNMLYIFIYQASLSWTRTLSMKGASLLRPSSVIV